MVKAPEPVDRGGFGPITIVVVIALSVFLFIILAAFTLNGSPKHPAPVLCAPQGNKVSLPDPPFTCVKDHNGRWVCTEGGRDA